MLTSGSLLLEGCEARHAFLLLGKESGVGPMASDYRIKMADTACALARGVRGIGLKRRYCIRMAAATFC